MNKKIKITLIVLLIMIVIFVIIKITDTKKKNKVSENNIYTSYFDEETGETQVKDENGNIVKKIYAGENIEIEKYLHDPSYNPMLNN